MTLKSLLQTLLGAFPVQGTPPTQIDVTRLQGRSDWPAPAGTPSIEEKRQEAAYIASRRQGPPRLSDEPTGMQGSSGPVGGPVETDGGGADMVPPWDRPGARYHSPLTCDPWPPNDDPYTVPCEMVPDPALAGLDKLASRGLTRPMNSVKSVTDLLQLIQRQEAAEKALIEIGFVWNPDTGEWRWFPPKP